MKTKRPDGRRSKACSANKGNLERLMREPGRYPVSDAPGMFFKVKAPGKAFWTYRYRFGGRESELSIRPSIVTTGGCRGNRLNGCGLSRTLTASR